jgi:hypothetical protein
MAGGNGKQRSKTQKARDDFNKREEELSRQRDRNDKQGDSKK